MKIDPSSIIASNAKIGENVEIGPFTVVHGNVEIGSDTKIGSHCEIGVPTALGDGSKLKIGAGSIIRSHSIFYESSSFGNTLVTGHRVTVREGTHAGLNLQIGTLGDIQGDCLIGDYVRFHSNVHIGKKSKIGNFVWIFPYVVLTNDPTPPSNTLIGCVVGDYSVIATMSVLLPGVCVGERALVGAHSCVGKSVPDNMIAVGNPAKIVGATSKIKLKDSTEAEAYPWTRHFHRGYPASVIDSWVIENSTDHLK